MKSFRLLTQQLSQWWQTSIPGSSQKPLNLALKDSAKQPKHFNYSNPMAQPWRKVLDLNPNQLASKLFSPRSSHPRRRKTSPPQQSALLTVAILSLTSAIGYRYYNDPQLGVGIIAPQTVRAPDTARVVDAKTTEEERQKARLGFAPVLMIDQTENQEIYQALQRLLDQGDTIREQVSDLPFVNPSTLSTTAQQYLRQAPEAEWKQAIASAQTNGTIALLPSTPNSSSNTPSLTNSSQQLAIIELQNYLRSASPEDFTALKQLILRARQSYGVAAKALVETADEPGSFYDVSLLNLTETEWNDTRAGVRRVLERMLLQGISPGLPDSALENAIRAQVADEVPSAGNELAIKMLTNIAKPNLATDNEKTRLLAEQAAQAVAQEVVEIRRGEVIVQQGQTITQADFVLLDHFGLSRRGINWPGLIGFATLVSGGVVIFLLIERRFHPGLRRRDHVLILLVALSAPLIIVLKVPTTSLPLVGLLVGSFFGSTLGVTVVALLGIALPMGMELSLTQLVASAIAGILGAVMAGRLRSREELAMLGGGVGLTQGAVYLILSLVVNSVPNPVWYAMATASALQGLLGVACSVIALGLSPYLENLFDLITPIRLAELSNPNRPLLKRLAAEAPGTFQHTLFVASLAEAAARSLSCNVELVRAGTLYHDIGKMHDPMGFIENQMGKPNKHDAINNPWKSCKIIKKHVSEGLVMARKYRLPRAIQAFIPEHQGTMLIAYFYHQAQQEAKANSAVTVDEAEFRYDGPIPQTRETGIVMLADSCEAALRSLKDATPEEALAMVNRILRARWQDNQLVDSGLTRGEMSSIAEIFVRVWQQFNHQRIAYPKMTPR
jgi:cyclic-di-AMP phosphodiesterase PgpH